MNNKHLQLVTIGLVAFILIGFLPSAVQGQEEDSDEQYEELLKRIDGMIRTRMLEKEISEERVENVQQFYESTLPSDMEVDGLFDEISSTREPEVETIRDLRAAVVDVAESDGFELPFHLDNAIFIILGITIGLAVTVNMISRTMVDWEEVNAMKKKQEELKEELQKAKEEKDHKKVHKLEQKNQQFMQENMGVMMSPMKTMLIIFIPFIIVLNVLSSVYSGWVVAWLPFKFPWPEIDFFLVSGFFKGNVAGLGYFGWYILAYFGLSQIFRKILVPSR
ncbi:MAG: EMC3/TMCO1 family protein [Candidatus Hadarchaeota archaeon]